MIPATLPTPSPKPLRTMFFWIGIFATLAYRAIIVLEHVDGPWLKITWYLGTLGFVAYFAHRFSVTEKRAKVISDFKLIEKIDDASWSSEDRSALRYVLTTLRSSKERWNYIMIFGSSAVAILVGLWLDLR